uniref:Uncharacterized protein n=1 Tax=Amphimedon queenslandica TaxID=400682 RepID=A0A1X7VMM6_AMPQE
MRIWIFNELWLDIIIT